MTKNQKISLASGGAVLLIMIVAAAVWNFSHADKKPQASAAQTVGDHTISLNQTEEPQDTGGLKVGSSTDGIGQLNSKINKNDDSRNSNSSSGGGSSIDPAKFGEYDKYKTASSAMYADIEPGTGKALGPNNKAIVVYKGWLTNGALFDESKVGSDGKVQAFSFTLGAHEVIPGWEQGMNGMKEGGIRLLIVPPSVGYGAKGQGPIPGNSVLVFAVKLISVQ